MKQMLLTFAILLSFLSTAAVADNERLITFNELPKAAQTFLNTYYADATIQYYDSMVQNIRNKIKDINEHEEWLYSDNSLRFI